MNIKYGINGSLSVDAARPITIKSTTAIAILAVAAKKTGLRKFNNATDALKFLDDEKIDGDVVNGLKAINLQGVNCPIVLNLCLDAKKLAAIDLFKKSESLTGVNLFGGLLIAPVLSADLSVGAKLDAIASILKMTAILDNFADTEADVIKWAKNFASQSSLLTFGKYTADGVSVTASSLYAGVMAYWDAQPFGFAKSHSNRVAKGVTAAERAIEYIDGTDCEARRMRQAGVACIVADIGWRTYGFETTDIEPVWQALDRIRTFKGLLQAILKSSKYARDREANVLLMVRQSVNEFMNELVGNEVLIGFAAYFDEHKNTNATATAGKFYFTIKVGDMPAVREFNIELVYSDAYNGVLINYINGDK